MWQSLGSWLAGGGAAGIAGSVAYLLYRFHIDAIRSAQREAAAYKEQRDYERRRADERERQLGIVLGRASETV